MPNDKQSAISSPHDPHQEKDSFENDPARALNPGADAAYTEKDTAARTSDHDAAQADDWLEAAPQGSEDEVRVRAKKDKQQRR